MFAMAVQQRARNGHVHYMSQVGTNSQPRILNTWNFLIRNGADSIFRLSQIRRFIFLYLRAQPLAQPDYQFLRQRRYPVASLVERV